MILCLAILIFMMVGYVVGGKFKISNGAVAMMSIVLISFTGILPAKTMMTNLLPTSSVQIIGMFIVAAGFSRTQAVKKVTQLVYKLSGGNFTIMLAGYSILTFALVNLGLTPMTAFAVVGPLAVTCCADFNVSPSKMIFPLALVCIVGCGVLPVSVASTTYVTNNGYLESYGYTDYAMQLLDPMKGRLPIALIMMVYAIFIAPRLCPAQASQEISFTEADVKAKTKKREENAPLDPVREILGYLIFILTTLALIFQNQLGDYAGWQIAFAGAAVVMFTGVLTPIVILTCQSLGCNPVGPLLLLYAARQSAFWTPAATGTIALAVGLGGYDQKDLIKMSWIPSLIIGVIGVFWIMTIFPAFPG